MYVKLFSWLCCAALNLLTPKSAMFFRLILTPGIKAGWESVGGRRSTSCGDCQSPLGAAHPSILLCHADICWIQGLDHWKITTRHISHSSRKLSRLSRITHCCILLELTHPITCYRHIPFRILRQRRRIFQTREGTTANPLITCGFSN
jgi:hypothetical protein